MKVKSTLKYMAFVAFCHLLIVPLVQGQCAPLANALPGLTLQHSVGVNNATGVAYNPNLNLYYIAQAGNPGFPLETFDAGGTLLYSTNTGFDMRGLWWNPNLNTLESNGYNTGGIWSYNMNGSGYALNTGTSIFPGNNQPTTQSVGDYNCVDDEIWYYNAGSIMKRDRATNALIGNFAISGLPVGTGNLNYNTVFYTDCPGYEIGLLDYVLKRVYFIDKTTMAYTGMSQLPAGAITWSGFRASWANGLVWLLDSGPDTWFSYRVLDNIGGPCTVPLPISLIGFEGEKLDNDKVVLNWSTSTEINNDYFTVHRSRDGFIWEFVGEVNGAGNSSRVLNYSLLDEDPYDGNNYYRLKQTDYDGGFEYVDIIAINIHDFIKGDEIVYPNPAITVLYIENKSEEISNVTVLNSVGEEMEIAVTAVDDRKVSIDVSHLSPGFYIIKTNHSVHQVLIQ